EIGVRTLLRNALRMRPDRIIVGEVRGGEALDMLQAMNTGHRGSLTTAHANGPYHALLRIETTALMGGIDLPLAARREQVRERELPAVCEALAAAVRAGLPVVDGLAAIAPSRTVGVASSLHESAALFRLGRSFDESTRPVDDAFGPPALLLRETLRAFYRRGGEVSRSLDRAGALGRRGGGLRRGAAALTAQGRASALVLALLAPCGLMFSTFVNPGAAL